MADTGPGAYLQQLYREHLLGTRAQPRVGLRLGSALVRPLNAVIGNVAAAPVRMGQSALANILLGRKARFGPMAGKRLHAMEGGPGKGLTEIGLKEFHDIKAGRVAGKAVKGRIGLMPHFYKRKFGPKGLVGLARKHPIMAALAGLVGYKMLSGGDEGTQTQRHQLSLDPEVLRGMQQRQAENPFDRGSWG